MEEIISFLISPDFSGWLLILKIVFLILALVLLILIIFALLRTTWFRWFVWSDLFEFLNYRPYGVKKFARRWLKIVSRLEKGSEAESKLAVIEADSLLDEILEQSGYKGEDLEEKLQSISEMILSNIKELKKEKKMRNNIVHDPDYKLSLEEAKKTLSIYEKALHHAAPVESSLILF